MKRILMFLFAALLAVGNGSAPACEPEAQPIQNDALWQGNRLTPDQPFPARVIGVSASWVGYQLLLEELDAKSPRYCYVHVAATGVLQYRQASKEQALQLAHWEEGTTPLPVSEFSIDNKLHQLGERFGANDLLRRAAAMTAREKQAQVAAAGSDVAGIAYDSVRIVSAQSKEIARSTDPETIALLLASMRRAQPAGSNTQGLSLTSILSLSSPESRRPAEGATPAPREVSSWYIDLQSGHFAPVSPPKLAIQRFTEADFAQLKEKLKIDADKAITRDSWHSLRVGMTREQVLEALKEAIPADRVTEAQRRNGCFIRPTDADLKADTWRITDQDPYLAEGGYETVELTFVEGKLTRIEVVAVLR